MAMHKLLILVCGSTVMFTRRTQKRGSSVRAFGAALPQVTSRYSSLSPYNYYGPLPVVGAKEHSLPTEYIRFLEPAEAVGGENLGREARDHQISIRIGGA